MESGLYIFIGRRAPPYLHESQTRINHKWYEIPAAILLFHLLLLMLLLTTGITCRDFFLMSQHRQGDKHILGM